MDGEFWGTMRRIRRFSSRAGSTCLWLGRTAGPSLRSWWQLS